MDDLIVIILTLIIAVVGALGQIKRRKQPQPDAENQKSPQDFWDMLLDEDEEVPVQPKAYDYEAPVTEEFTATGKFDVPGEVPVEERDYGFQPVKESVPDVAAEKTEEEKPKIKDKIKAAAIKEKFSLRQAVIYSEILNRKYT